jgi:hypothetical protein
MADFVSAVNDFFLKEKGICVNDVAFMEMPNEKEKYNLSKVIGNVNLCADRFKIKSEANAVIDKFLSMSLP